MINVVLCEDQPYFRYKVMVHSHRLQILTCWQAPTSIATRLLLHVEPTAKRVGTHEDVSNTLTIKGKPAHGLPAVGHNPRPSDQESTNNLPIKPQWALLYTLCHGKTKSWTIKLNNIPYIGNFPRGSNFSQSLQPP